MNAFSLSIHQKCLKKIFFWCKFIKKLLNNNIQQINEMSIYIIILLWAIGQGLFIWIEFGLVYFMISCFFFIFYNTTERTGLRFDP